MTEAAISFTLKAGGPLIFESARKAVSLATLGRILKRPREVAISKLKRGEAGEIADATFDIFEGAWKWAVGGLLTDGDLIANADIIRATLQNEVDAINADMSAPTRAHIRVAKLPVPLPFAPLRDPPAKPSRSADIGVLRAWRRAHHTWLGESIGKMDDAAPSALRAYETHSQAAALFGRIRIHLEALDWPVPLTMKLDPASSERDLWIVLEVPPELNHVGPRLARIEFSVGLDKNASLTAETHRKVIVLATCLAAAVSVGLYLSDLNVRLTIRVAEVTEAAPHKHVDLMSVSFSNPFWSTPSSALGALENVDLLGDIVAGLVIR